MSSVRNCLPAIALLALLVQISCTSERDEDYQARVEAWRVDRQVGLVADDGWLTLSGLFFLEEGKNSFGSSAENDIVLPSGPGRAGIVTLRNGVVEATAAAGRSLLVDSREVSAAKLGPCDAADRATIAIGRLSLFCHASGERIAIRMRDPESAIRRDFTGLRWYPVDGTFRVRGRLVPDEEPRSLALSNSLGDILTLPSAGVVYLKLHGVDLSLTAIDYNDRLWFVFRDLTSGTETYPAARFLYADRPDRNGWTTVDFNLAYNPPCAYNPNTTCPLPPPENNLPVAITVGELDYLAQKQGHGRGTDEPRSTNGLARTGATHQAIRARPALVESGIGLIARVANTLRGQGDTPVKIDRLWAFP